MSAPEQTSLDRLFAEFWAAYPRKVGKLGARRSWDKARQLVSADLILTGARRMAADPNLPSKKYIPYPATWLANGGWDDEPFPEPERLTGPPVPGQSAWDR